MRQCCSPATKPIGKIYKVRSGCASRCLDTYVGTSLYYISSDSEEHTFSCSTFGGSDSCPLQLAYGYC